MDCPQQIGYRATISAPHMHAAALEWLKDFITPSSTVLDVGSGSGYLCVCMSFLGAKQVHGIEHIQELVDVSIQNVNKSHSYLLANEKVKI